jgi:Putative heavy-metal-binding
MTDDATGEVLVSTTFELPGYAVERTVGVAWGLIVRSIGVAKGLTGSFRSLRSGEVDEYTALVDNARRTALEQRWAAMRCWECGLTRPTSAMGYRKSSPTALPHSPNPRERHCER